VERERKKKKVVGAKPDACRQHVSANDGGNAETNWMAP